jgi:hypothetical protein
VVEEVTMEADRRGEDETGEELERRGQKRR